MLSEEHEELKLRVAGTEEIAEGVLRLDFEGVGGGDLAAWQPGAHIELHLPSGLIRQYSLCSDPADSETYSVCVLLDELGRGGSQEVHRELVVGSEIVSRAPRNLFELTQAPDYLLIAGGIGITPIRAMVRELDRRGDNWRLVYGGRQLSAMAFADELRALHPDRVKVVPEDSDGRIDVSGVLRTAGSGTHIFCCGPAGLIDAVDGICKASVIGERLHVERFSASNIEELVRDGDEGFDVELAVSGVTVHIAAGQTILEAVQAVRGDVDHSCMEGYCGSCETRVLAGQPDHRGTLMSPEEHDEDGTMLICVGRSRSPKFVLDL